MTKTPEILFLITARGGSKGVPGKNLKKLGGLSLVGYKARAALGSKYCSRLIISSEDPAIIEEAKVHGAEAPFVRPAELASDTAASTDVVKHAIEWIEQNEGRSYDAIMLCEPSAPFARAEDFDRAVELYMQRGAELVAGMREVEPASIFVAPMDENGCIGQIVTQMQQASGLRRQDQRPEVTMNGCLYLFSWDNFKKTSKIYDKPEKSFGIMMDRHHSVEIDEVADLAYAEFVIEKGYVNPEDWGVHKAGAAA